jgi:hypothetical protein
MMPPCTGRSYYQSDREEDEHTLLVAVPCLIGRISRTVFALLDTASEWCVLPHDLTVELGEELELLPAASSLHTRFGLLSGTLGRLTIRFPAAEGQSLEVDTTCFASEGWLGPMVVGWKGCLERIRFGLDPSDQFFYFGAW